MSETDKAHILIVEDERKIHTVVRAYLERDGHTVEVAESGERALGLFKGQRTTQRPFELVVLDLMLPDIQGEELCAIIRESSDIPIIMLTAKSSEDDRVRGLGMGADDYVVKPFSPRELAARVEALLRRTRKGGRTLKFSSGALVIDLSKREVMKGSEQLTLTPTEFGILVALAEKPGRVLSRLQLVNMVQGYDFEGYERTVDAHVKNLRHKLEDDPRKPRFIKTVYGVGYKFTASVDED